MPVQPESLDQASSPRRCIGCCEPIQPSAHICPHCRTAQARSRWAALGSALKWIGSITALLSLVFALVQLRSLVADKVNRDRAVHELLAAARAQADAQDFEGAWSLSSQAMELNAVSPDVRSLQVELAMRRLRNTERIKETDLRNSIEALIPIFHRGVIAGTDRQRADVLAHLARANEHLHDLGDRWIDVDLCFERALEKEPDNVYANAWYGHWLLKTTLRTSADGQRALGSIPHFRRAIASGREYEFARYFQISCLNRKRKREYLQPDIGMELITIGSALEEDPRDLPATTYELLATSFFFLVEQWDRRNDYFQHYAPGRILEMYSFLCSRSGWLAGETDPEASHSRLLIEAVLLEADGRVEEAFSRLQRLLDGSYFRYDVSVARMIRERLWEKQGASLAEALFVRSMDSLGSGKQAGLHPEDVILRVNHHPITEVEGWDAALAELPPQAANYPVTLLRGEHVITLTLPRSHFGHLGVYFESCRVPARLIDALRK